MYFRYALFFVPILLSSLGLYFLGSNLLKSETSSLQEYLPDEVDFAMEINLNEIAPDVIYNLLFHSKEINDNFKFKPKKEDSLKVNINTGISFSSNIIMAREHWKEGDLNYVILPLNNKEVFLKFAQDLAEKDSNIVFYSKDKVGVLGWRQNVNFEIAQNYIEKIGGKEFKSLNGKYPLNQYWKRDKPFNLFLNTNHANQFFYWEDLFMSIGVEGNKIALNGELESSITDIIQPITQKKLKPRGMHMTSSADIQLFYSLLGEGQLDKVWQDLPKMKQWSVNHLGTKVKTFNDADSILEYYVFPVAQMDQQMQFIPDDKFEVLLYPENVEEFKVYLTSLIDMNLIKWDGKEIWIKSFGRHQFVQKEDYFLLSPLKDEQVSLVDVSEADSIYFDLSFDLDDFLKNTEVEGDDSFTGRLINSASARFIDSKRKDVYTIDELKLEIKSQNKDLYFQGGLHFRDPDAIPSIELLKVISSF